MGGMVYSSVEQGRVTRIARDLIAHRGLLFDLVWKEQRARYRNAMMGYLWAILQPLCMMLILTFVFSVLLSAKLERFGGGRDIQVSYAAFVLCGIVFWQFTATSLVMATRSLLDNQELIKKIHFPREVIPIATVVNAAVNVGIGLAVLLAVHLALGGGLGVGLFWVPLVFAVQCALTIGAALLLACANVHLRDTAYLVEIALTFGFYASPVLYPLEWVARFDRPLPLLGNIDPQPALTWIYSANPMAGLLTGYHQTILTGHLDSPRLLIWPAVCAFLMLLVGAYVFRRSSSAIADSL